jgi:alkanesulfonate monooxygenase SsuD/methylene tetrahydromethanopterin reductase-like flavin-dependent oxidoreductase (luciferase family)
MRVGFHVGQVVLQGADLQRQYRDHLEQMRAARDAGFDFLSWGHHWLIHPFQHFQPIPMLARFAAEAGPMELATLLLLTPLLNPIAVAEEIATLDHICEGRFTLGIGLGYRPEECEAAGIRMDERAERFVEGLGLMKRLWTEEEVTHDGRFYHVTNAHPTARCYQRPHPRIWLAGMTDAGVRRAGSLGHPFAGSGLQSLGRLRRHVLLWREEMARQGHAPEGELPLLREFYLSADRAEALRRAARSIEKKYSAYAEHGFPGASGEMGRGLDALVEDTFIVGGPDECVERLTVLAELGFTHVSLRLFWPLMEQRDVLAMIEQTGATVIPRLRAARRARPSGAGSDVHEK